MTCLTPEDHSRLCWRVAGTAVIHALSGVAVHRVEVAAPGTEQAAARAPNAATGWPVPWGLIETDDTLPSGDPVPALAFVMPDTAWDGPGEAWSADAAGLRQALAALSPAAAAELRRAMRGRVCAMMGGYLAEQRAARIGHVDPVADQSPTTDQALNFQDPSWASCSDVQQGLAIASLFGTAEAQRLAGITAAALAEPGIWRKVAALADALADALQTGTCQRHPQPWMPAPRMGWPDLS